MIQCFTIHVCAQDALDADDMIFSTSLTDTMPNVVKLIAISAESSSGSSGGSSKASSLRSFQIVIEGFYQLVRWHVWEHNLFLVTYFVQECKQRFLMWDLCSIFSWQYDSLELAIELFNSTWLHVTYL